MIHKTRKELSRVDLRVDNHDSNVCLKSVLSVRVKIRESHKSIGKGKKNKQRPQINIAFDESFKKLKLQL